MLIAGLVMLQKLSAEAVQLAINLDLKGLSKQPFQAVKKVFF